MVGVFGGGMVVHFSPKDLGLSAWIFETIFGQSNGIYGLLWVVLGRIVGLLFGPCVLFLCYC